MYTKILGTGSYLPAQIRTNADLEKMVDTTDEWIVTRTGIRERRLAGDDETVVTMGHQAALNALDMAGIPAGDIDLIVVGTTSSTHGFRARPVKSRNCWALTAASLLMWRRHVPVSAMPSVWWISSLKPGWRKKPW